MKEKLKNNWQEVWQYPQHGARVLHSYLQTNNELQVKN